MELLNCESKKSVDIYSYMSYHLFLSFEWRLNHGMEGSKFMCIIRWRGKGRGIDCIPSHVRRVLDADKIV